MDVAPQRSGRRPERPKVRRRPAARAPRVQRLRVGGVLLEVRSRHPCPALGLAPRLRPFLVPGTAGRPDMRLRLVARPVPAAGPLLFDSGGTWCVRRSGAGLLYAFAAPRGGGPAARGVWLDRRRTHGQLFLPHSRWSAQRGFALAYPLDELLFQHHLAQRGGFVVHASGIDLDGRALLFCGPSGSGKSTLASLWARARVPVLSDDRLALRPAGRDFTAWGTPWHGSGRFGAAAGRPLGAVFFIAHGARSLARPLGAAEAAARLFACSFPPLWERASVARVLAACARVAARVPCFALRVRPDAGLRALVRGLVDAGRKVAP